jgi:hypothetical protein
VEHFTVELADRCHVFGGHITYLVTKSGQTPGGMPVEIAGEIGGKIPGEIPREIEGKIGLEIPEEI